MAAATTTTTTTKVSLKLLIDTKTQRVLFAEAGKDFVDFLFHLLHLPLGTVIRLLTKESMVGTLGNLYDSVENLSKTYLQPKHQNKESLLNPKAPLSPEVPLLFHHNGSASRPEPNRFYLCSGSVPTNSSGRNVYHCYVADDPRAVCPQCKWTLSTEAAYVPPAPAPAGEGGFVKGVVTYMVMDDLVVKPLSTISIRTLLNKFNVKDVGALEERVVDLGMNEALKLLKASLHSKTVLTIVFL